MSKESKTARASLKAGQVKTEVKVISDEQYIKNLRSDLENGLYVAQEGARALLRSYDALSSQLNLEQSELGLLKVSECEQRERADLLQVQFDAAIGSLAQFIVETFPNDYVEGADVVETAIQIFKDLLQANEGVSSLARKLAQEAEERNAPPQHIEQPNVRVAPVHTEYQVEGPTPTEGLQINLPQHVGDTIVVKTPVLEGQNL